MDDRPYGGGPGMVLKVEPLRDALRAARAAMPAGARAVYLGADGVRFDQQRAREARDWPGLILVAGRYEGVDERFVECEIDEQWSIGDYVLTGGELPALVVIDAVARLLPGTLGSEESALQESFSEGLLDWPHYTRPVSVDGREVPAGAGFGRPRGDPALAFAGGAWDARGSGGRSCSSGAACRTRSACCSRSSSARERRLRSGAGRVTEEF